MIDKNSSKNVEMSAESNLNRTSWQRKLPSVEDRDWFTVQEVAEILLNRGIIHRISKNKYGTVKITGIQQVRKYIREEKLKGKLYENSKKYGYIIDKTEVDRFCVEKKTRIKREI